MGKNNVELQQVLIPGQTSLIPCQGWKGCQWKKKTSLRSLWPPSAFQARYFGADLTSCSCPGAGSHPAVVPHTTSIMSGVPPLRLFEG